MTSATIASGSLVTLRYTLHDEQDAILATSGDGSQYIHGRSSLVPGLEKALAGRSAGEQFSVTLAPEDAYGPSVKSPGPQPIPRGTFPDEMDLHPGMEFEAETPDGSPITLYIVQVHDHAVFVDSNHPFAGMTLRYEVEVVDVSDAPTE